MQHQDDCKKSDECIRIEEHSSGFGLKLIWFKNEQVDEENSNLFVAVSE